MTDLVLGLAKTAVEAVNIAKLAIEEENRLQKSVRLSQTSSRDAFLPRCRQGASCRRHDDDMREAGP
jgi:hypothetical protein